MRTVLVTGGAGFIGANFVSSSVQQKEFGRIIVYDAMTYSASPVARLFPDRPSNLHVIEADVCDYDRLRNVISSENVDRIVHFAAETHVDRSIVQSELFVRSNVVGTERLLQAARDCWERGGYRGRRFVNVSTDEVYGSLSPDSQPFTETSAYSPNSIYAATKAASDHLVRAYHRTYGLPCITVNTSNNYGPMQYPEKLIPLAIDRVLRGAEIPLYGNGRNIRDWIYVADHCEAIFAALERGAAGERYNIGGHCELENIAVVEAICATVDRCFAAGKRYSSMYPDAPPVKGVRSSELVRYVDDRPAHDFRYALDSTKAERELGFTVRTPFGEGLERTVKWYLDNPGWWGAT
ncbi:MAG: dTDP-glucose 4,6-dehydratase [Pseudomonadota bacterium]